MRASTKQSLLGRIDAAHDSGRLYFARNKVEANQLARGVRCGLLVRPLLGLYARRERWQNLKPDEKILFAARAAARKHPEWVFAGTTAALAHGLSVSWSCLDRPCIATSRHAQAHDHGSLRRIVVSADSPVIRAGILVTSFLRTIYDCLRSMPFCDALALADSALRSHDITSERLRANVSIMCNNMPGRRRVLDILALADGRSESGGESIARAQMIALGFEVPDLQRKIEDPLSPGNFFRGDFAWDLPDGTVVIGELDGKEKNQIIEMTAGRTVDEVLLDERRREARLTLAREPIRIVRFSLAEAKSSHYFERLLSAYGVPRLASTPDIATAC